MSELKINSQIVLLKDIKMENSRKEANMLKGGKKKKKNKTSHSVWKLLLHGKPVTGNISFQPICHCHCKLVWQVWHASKSSKVSWSQVCNEESDRTLPSFKPCEANHSPSLSQFPLLWNGEKWPFPIHFQAYYKDHTRQGSVKKSVLGNQSALLCCLEAFYLSFLGLIFPIYRMGPHLTFLNDILPSYM